MKRILTLFSLMIAMNTAPVFAQGYAGDEPVIPEGMLSAQTMEFDGDHIYPVYSAPDDDSLRGANGHAKVSTNDWIQVFGSSGSWILIQYDVSSEHYRIGYILKNSLPKGTEIAELNFTDTPAILTADTAVTDDPIAGGSELAVLEAGTGVTQLAIMGDWRYIEAEQDGKRLRGFIPFESASESERVTSLTEAQQALCGTWDLYAGSSFCADTLTFSADGSLTGENGKETWQGTWSVEAYDADSGSYWNEPEFELTVRKDAQAMKYGLRVCHQAEGTDGNRYALILSDGAQSGGFVLTE